MKEYTAECGPGRRAKIVGSFDQTSRNMFERRVNRKERKWRVDVRQGEDDSERAIEEKFDGVARDVEILQQAVEHTVAAEDCFPGVSAHEITGPQGNYHELI